MSRIAGVVVAVLAAVAFPACGDRDETRDELLAAINRTEQETYRFVYEDSRPEQTLNPSDPVSIAVQGLIEDDFRFKARVAYNGSDAWDQVVSDDLLAIRFIAPGRISELVNKEKVAHSDTKTDIEGASSLQVLQSRRWVIDESAAPTVAVGRVRETELGKDPVLDAVTALTYVEQAVREADRVVEFNPDSVQPTYSSSEDTFPEPEDGSGVTRYDLRRPKLPPPGAQTPGLASGMPATRHFRRMAIYVKDGRVIQVREEVNVRGKMVKDVGEYLERFAKEGGASDDEVASMRELLSGGDDAGDRLLEVLNLGLSVFGEQPVLQRSMTLDIRDLGANVKVDLPTTDVVKGGLEFLIVSEKGKVEAEGEATETAPSEGTTETSTTDTTAAGDSAGTDTTTAPPPSP